MKTRTMFYLLLAALFVFAGNSFANEEAEEPFEIDLRGTEGEENTLYGYLAGNSITTGKYNSLFGTNAGTNSTTGKENSFFGYNTGYNNTTGKQNSFFGIGTGLLNTTGNRNSSFGYNAGWSTYWAVVLAPTGSARFTQNAEYFENKRVIFCGLASSGEFFYKAVKGDKEINAKTLKASSHGAAIDALDRGAADIAIVKNRVWENIKGKYELIDRVGEDPGENPNMTLIVSRKADPKIVEKITTILLGLKNDNSPEAESVKKRLGITGFIKTTIDDFKFTIPLLKRAGVDESFDFSF